MLSKYPRSTAKVWMEEELSQIPKSPRVVGAPLIKGRPTTSALRRSISSTSWFCGEICNWIQEQGCTTRHYSYGVMFHWWLEINSTIQIYSRIGTLGFEKELAVSDVASDSCKKANKTDRQLSWIRSVLDGSCRVIFEQKRRGCHFRTLLPTACFNF